MSCWGWSLIQYDRYPYKRRDLDTVIYRGITWRHRENMAIYKPRREASEETSPTLIWDLQLPEQWGNKFLLFIPQSLLYSFMAFLADKCKIIYFAYLKKKMNERKLKKLLHFLGNFEISQNWSFLWFPHLRIWWFLCTRACVIWSLADVAFLFKG